MFLSAYRLDQRRQLVRKTLEISVISLALLLALQFVLINTYGSFDIFSQATAECLVLSGTGALIVFKYVRRFPNSVLCLFIMIGLAFNVFAFFRTRHTLKK